MLKHLLTLIVLFFFAGTTVVVAQKKKTIDEGNKVAFEQALINADSANNLRLKITERWRWVMKTKPLIFSLNAHGFYLKVPCHITN